MYFQIYIFRVSEVILFPFSAWKCFYVQLFLLKTTSNKDQLEVCLPNSRLLSGLIGMWQCWDWGPIFRKWSKVLTFSPTWSELGILFHEKLKKLTFHLKLVSIYALKLWGTNPPMGCITISLATALIWFNASSHKFC